MAHRILDEPAALNEERSLGVPGSPAPKRAHHPDMRVGRAGDHRVCRNSILRHLESLRLRGQRLPCSVNHSSERFFIAHCEIRKHLAVDLDASNREPMNQA